MTLLPELRYAIGVSRFTKDEFELFGATINTGPTGTNVNDIAITIRWAREPNQ